MAEEEKQEDLTTKLQANEQLAEQLRDAFSVLEDEEMTEYFMELFTDPNSVELVDAKEVMRCMIGDKLTEIKLLDLEERIVALVKSAISVDSEDNDLDLENMEKNERDGLCKLCGTNNRITIHHLIPKLVLKRMRNKGKPKVEVSQYLVEVCRPCHNELHRLWGHGELAADYQTVDMILEAPEIQSYLTWKRKKEGTLVSEEDM
eukprot:CAMPEP_0174263462 /NCGR_PEP_ID=MMETSP0439-20130205/18813_1 /TAXON_ID=0 /ORGANISM="Stereomyxa ramosa, Strain Chinc5" /LENGTH=203 /DNA_ID=CAMNT_0015348817 /DNA_START=43 /DNA_END=654 /DNA_ORIENTATION=+